MRAIEDRRDDCGSDKTHNDQNSATDTSLVFGVSVRIEDLVQERGKGVEEPDVGDDGDEDDPEGWGADTRLYRWKKGDFGDF